MSSVPKFDSLALRQAYLGVSLTCFMATAVRHGLHQHRKKRLHSGLPLVYAASSLGIAVITHFQSNRTYRQLFSDQPWYPTKNAEQQEGK